jgi:hypothetical protein
LISVIFSKSFIVKEFFILFINNRLLLNKCKEKDGM